MKEYWRTRIAIRVARGGALSALVLFLFLFGREGARLLVVALRGGDSTHYYDIPEYLVFLPNVA